MNPAPGYSIFLLITSSLPLVFVIYLTFFVILVRIIGTISKDRSNINNPALLYAYTLSSRSHSSFLFRRLFVYCARFWINMCIKECKKISSGGRDSHNADFRWSSQMREGLYTDINDADISNSVYSYALRKIAEYRFSNICVLI